MGEGVRGEILRSDESCIGNPRLETANWTPAVKLAVQFAVSNLGFPMQDSSDLKISCRRCR